MLENNNPWIGLESYDEKKRMYGRDKDILELSQLIFRSRGTLLYGRSGIGKTSLVNAGVKRAAKKEGIFPINIRLCHGKSDENYSKQIIESINATNHVLLENVSDTKESISKNLLWEYFHCNKIVDEDGLRQPILLIFDQFEEIFTLQKDVVKRKSFFEQIGHEINNWTPPEYQNPIKSTAEDGLPAFQFKNYTNTNEIHLLFSLREDFLSEFEYYTAHIPSLANNRYGLRPINEEQAKQIICDPIPGMVDEDVAKRIISHITEKNDFSFDGTPELEVDALILSLLLYRLYQKKTGEKITANLVNENIKKIVLDFYRESISGLHRKTIRKLEELLIANGRRDNIPIERLEKAIGKVNVEAMIRKKLLVTFSHSNGTRIEFVHDIILQAIEQHHNETRVAESKKRWLTTIILSILLASIGSFLFVILKDDNVQTKSTEFHITFIEDETINKTESWYAYLTVLAHRKNLEDTILIEDYQVNEHNKNELLSYKVDSLSSVVICLDFKMFPRFKSIVDTLFSKRELNTSPTLKIPIGKNNHNKYYGRVLYPIGNQNHSIPVQDVIVIIADQIQKTDSGGYYSFFLDDTVKVNDPLYIVRDGFKNSYLVHRSRADIQYLISDDKDSNFLNRCDSLIRQKSRPTWDCRDYPVVAEFADGTWDNMYISTNTYPSKDDNRIYGYFYFENKSKLFESEMREEYSYYLFEGTIEKRTSNGSKNYELTCYDIARNKYIIHGMNENGVHKGVIFNSAGQIIASYDKYRKLDQKNRKHW